MNLAKHGLVAVALLFAACPMPAANAAPTPINEKDAGPQPMQSAIPLDITGELSPRLKDARDAIAGRRYGDALAITKQIIAAKAVDQLAPAYELQGIALYLQGETESAILALKKSVETDPRRSSAFSKLGSIDLDAGYLDEAQKNLQQAISLNNGDRLAHQRLGALLERKGDRAGAIKQYQIAATDPQSGIGVKVDLGRLYNEDHQFSDTVHLLAPLGSPVSSDPTALLVLGTAYLGAGDAAKALTVLRDASSGAPDDAGVALGLGIAERAAGQFDKSAATLQHVLELKKDWATGYYQLGLTYIAQSKYAEAQSAMEKARALDPNAASVQEALGESMLLGGNPEQAISVFRTSTYRDNARLGDFVLLATAYQSVGKLDDAERTYRDAVQRFPKDPTAFLRLGAMLAVERKYDDALKVLQQGTSIDPRNPLLLRDVAFVQARLNRYPDAIATARRLVELDPKNASGTFLLATLYQDSGDKKQAILSYQQTLANNPDYALALNNLAALLTDENNAAAAIPLAERAVALMPRTAATLDTLGWALLSNGRKADAVTMLRKASELAPDNPEQLYRLAVAENAAGDRAGARQHVQKALQLNSAFRDAEPAKALMAELSR